MRFSGSLILVGIVCALGGVALWLDTENDEAQTLHAIRSWSEIEVRSIHELQVTRNQKKMSFKKDAEGFWWMTTPEQIFAYQIKVHQILNAVLKPHVQREIHRTEELKRASREKGTELVFLYGKKQLRARYFTLAIHPGHEYIDFPDEGDIVYKVLKENSPDLSLDTASFRTLRIFPFELFHVAKLRYRCGDAEVGFFKKDNRLHADRPLSPGWPELLKSMSQAACEEYRSLTVDSEFRAEYEFEFISGRKASARLFYSDLHGWFVQYPGRDLVQIISEKTKKSYFPGAEES